MAIRMKQYFDKAYKKSKKDFMNVLVERAESGKATFVITANPEIFMLGKKQKEMNDALMDENTFIVPDGIGILHAGEQLGYNFEERIPGVEICEMLFEYANKEEKRIFLFGAEPQVLIALKKKINESYPGAIICGAENGYVQNKEKVFKENLSKEPDIVLVALGAPAQELMIYRHFDASLKGIFVGVGGSFDVLSGKKKRAPQFFIKHNLEWLYRITTEPKRIKRFWNNNIKFLFEIRKEKNETK